MHRKILFFLIFGFFCGAGTLVVFAADQIKTTTQLAGASSTAISSSTNFPFAFYIGDNLTGITNPVKSLAFSMSGTYTGNGTLAISLDSDPATTQTFTLPNVGATPTPFEFLYKDPSNKINPTSAGSYSYTLNVIPSGVIIYSFGAEMKESHRFTQASCPDGAPANEKIKTTTQLAGASSTAISSSTNFPFAFYIGDNLTGITNPVKSLAFSTSGTYTGNGTLAISLDSDPATTQTFTLPNVGTTPTPFEFLYKDPSNKINPTSAGSYSYTLNVIPSGVIIYSFGAEMKESHRYKPTTCGGGYAASGFVESSTFDTGVAQGAGYSSILWQGTLLSDTKVRIQLATSNSSSGPWIYYGPDCTTSAYYGNSPDLPEDVGCPALHNNKRYFRYKTTLCSSIASGCTASGTNTPTVNDVMVNWNP